MDKYYITTPIYYASGKLHLGHCSSTVIADALSRYNRLKGKDVLFLTGSDEHGLKIERAAKKAGLKPQDFIDGIVEGFKDLWKKLDISYDRFIRTTDSEHIACVEKIFNKLYEKGYIYLSKYSGLYCTPCEAFWKESQLIDGKCPDCHRDVEFSEEESYFFKLSQFTDFLIDLLKDDKFVKFERNRNELLNNFLYKGLDDLCVSRTTFDWGIRVPFNQKHVIYVWIDALANYISALGYLSDDDKDFKKYWPADVHIVGKDIARFHILIWPSLLKALDIPLPKTVHTHGWFTVEGAKMGKSLGNAFDIDMLIDRYGSDAVRYYILRHGPVNGDVPYSASMFLSSFNADLCNDLGNLVSRTLALLKQNFDGEVFGVNDTKQVDKDLIAEANELFNKVDKAMEDRELEEGISYIMNFVSKCNKYVDLNSPWILAKNDKERLKTVLSVLVESIRVIGVNLSSFLPKTSAKLLKAVGCERVNLDCVKFGEWTKNKKLNQIEALFPRLNFNEELKILDGSVSIPQKDEKNNCTVQNAQCTIQNAQCTIHNSECTINENQLQNKGNSLRINEKLEPDNEKSFQNNNITEQNTKDNELITIEDFAKVKLVVAKVLKCEKVENADKLLKSTLQVGDEERIVLSGIAKHYTPEEMVGKSVILVSNLAPRKMRGIESQGMLLCAEDEDGVCLLTVEKDKKSGSEVR